MATHKGGNRDGMIVAGVCALAAVVAFVTTGNTLAALGAMVGTFLLILAAVYFMNR